MLAAPSPASAWEVRLCDSSSCTCWKGYSGPILVKLPNLNTVYFDQGPSYCTSRSLGAYLTRIERRASTNHWRAQLFGETDYRTPKVDRGYEGAWPVSVPSDARGSLVLLGPAARFCRDAACTVFTDVVEPDQFAGGPKANTEDQRQNWPGRVARVNLATGDHATCDYCTWKLQVSGDDVVPFPVDPNAHIENDISRVMVRDPYFHLAYCRSSGFSNCRSDYVSGPADLPLAGGDWDNDIESFDLVRDLGEFLELDGPHPVNDLRFKIYRPDGGVPNQKGPGSKCSELDGLGAVPSPPITCTTHAACAYPYVCTTSGKCAVGACFADRYQDASSDRIRTFYNLAVDKNVLGFDLIAIYLQNLPIEVVQWAHATAVNATAYLRGDYANVAPGHGFDRINLPYNDFDIVIRPDILFSGSPGGYVDVPLGGFLRPGGVRIDPGNRNRIMETFHEFGHVTQTFYQGRDFGNCPTTAPGAGLSEAVPKMLEQSHGNANTDYEGVLAYWPYMEYCRVSATAGGPNPPGSDRPCLNYKFSDFPVYNTFAQGYAAFGQFAYLSAQFMMPDPGLSGAAIDPRSYIFPGPSPAPTELYKPLRYHRYLREVMSTVPANYPCNPSAPDDRYVWMSAMSTAAAAGTQHGSFVRCTDRDPSACPVGAAPSAFAAGANFRHAFARWGQTHFLANPRYTPSSLPYSDAQRSRMHLKYEPGGIKGVYNHGAQENPSLTSVPFVLPVATKFTIIITAETNFYSAGDPLWRDALRVWVDSNDAAHWAGGRKYDDEYADGDQCWAFGHDPSGSVGCRYTIGGETETDGGQTQTGNRATMRFIPSTAFPAWATTNPPAGTHTVNIGAFNDPRVYSVEVVLGTGGTTIVPHRRPLKLRMYYCCKEIGLAPFGSDCTTPTDPLYADTWCRFPQAAASLAVGSMGAGGNKIVQLMAGADRLGAEFAFDRYNPGAGSMNEFSYVTSTHATEPQVVGTEVDFAGLHGEAAIGNRYVLRLEKNLASGRQFVVSSHANPRYDHVVTWDRPSATLAARYFPHYRGMNFHGFLVDPYASTAAVRVELPPGVPAGTPVVLNLYCESSTGAWSIVPGYENGLTLAADGTWRYFTGLTGCARVNFQVGMAAPRYDDDGQGLWLTFLGQ